MADAAGGKILLYEFTPHFTPGTNDCEFLFCVMLKKLLLKNAN